MKKTFIIATVLILILSLFAPSLSEEGSYIISTESGTKLHLRQKPSRSSKSLGLYFNGAEVELIGKAGSWLNVKIGEETGYMFKDFLVEKGSVPVEDKRPLGFINSENASLKQKPTANSAQILSLKYLTELVVIGETSNSWYYVSVSGTFGYIKSSFVSFYFENSSNTNTRLFTGTAVIDGGNSNKVHLRKEPNVKSESLGLYFTGTELECFTEHNQPWIGVKIGQSFGFIQSRYLSFTNSENLKKFALYSSSSVNAKLNIREGASQYSRVLRVIGPKEKVRVLGETKNGWYYVNIGNTFGYIKSENMRRIP